MMEKVRKPKREKKCKYEGTFREMLNIIAKLERQIDQSDKERLEGQRARKAETEQIFKELNAISERNKKLNGLYDDIQRSMNLWKKYGKPVVWFITFVGGAALVAWRIYEIIRGFTHK